MDVVRAIAREVVFFCGACGVGVYEYAPFMLSNASVLRADPAASAAASSRRIMPALQLACWHSTGAFRTEAPRREKSRPTPNPDRDDVRKVHLLGLAQGDRPPGLARPRRATPNRDRRALGTAGVLSTARMP